MEKLKSGIERARKADDPRDQLAGLQAIEFLGKMAPGADELIMETEAVDAIVDSVGSSPKKSTRQLTALSAIANLSCRSAPLRQVMVDKGATEALLSIATANDMKGEEHQKPALIGLVNLSIDPLNKPKMIAKGLVEAMLALSGAEDMKGTDIQIFALNVLLSLSASPPEEKAEVLAKGTVPVAIGLAFMKEGASESRHITALQILVNLSITNPEVQVDIFNRGLASNLVDLAKPPGTTPATCNGEHLAWVLRVLVNLSINPELRPKLAELGLADVLIGLINAPETKGTEHQLIAVDTIASLAKDPVAGGAILKNGLETINKIGSSDDYFASQVQLCALEAIAGLTAQDESVRAALIMGGTLDTILKVANDDRVMATTIQRPCIVSMVNLSLESDGKYTMQEKGAVPLLVKICKAEPCQRTDILLFALKALASMAACQDGAKASMVQHMLDEGVAEQVISVTTNEVYQGSHFQMEALQVIVNLCAGAGKTENAMIEKGTVEALVGVCNSELLQGSAHQMLAVRALTNLSQDPDTRTTIKSKGVPDALVKIQGQKDSEKLSGDLVAAVEEAMGLLSVNQ